LDTLGLAAPGSSLLLTSSFTIVLARLVLVGFGAFFAQAAATGYLSRTATADRGSAGGIAASLAIAALLASTVRG